MSEIKSDNTVVMVNKVNSPDEVETTDEVVETVKENKEEEPLVEPVVEKEKEVEEVDPYCVEEDCKCHMEDKTAEDSANESTEEEKEVEEEESSEEDEDKVILVQHEYPYVPPLMTFLAYLVLILHLINAILKLNDTTPTCFPRPY